jgi:hypothetical protein
VFGNLQIRPSTAREQDDSCMTAVDSVAQLSLPKWRTYLYHILW